MTKGAGIGPVTPALSLEGCESHTDTGTGELAWQPVTGAKDYPRAAGPRFRELPMTARLLTAPQQGRQLRGRRVVCSEGGEPLMEAALSSLVGRAARRAGLATGR